MHTYVKYYMYVILSIFVIYVTDYLLIVILT